MILHVSGREDVPTLGEGTRYGQKYLAQPVLGLCRVHSCFTSSMSLYANTILRQIEVKSCSYYIVQNMPCSL